ncbi:MAG: tRNA lysidine(34) synthetase TilS [Gallionella sp.]
MASSRKFQSGNLTERVSAEMLPLLPTQSSILIGLSGGVDSVVLLHLLHRLSTRFNWQLSALHVHHGISANADAWRDFCIDLCARINIPLCTKNVDIAPLRGMGIEAAARKLRHTAFAGQECDFVALAHHADDQAETLLLQLLRGAGVRGASAMPQIIHRSGTASLVRPLLHCSRAELLVYADENNLQWIEDESNQDDRHPRNYLRHRVLPLLDEKFPAFRNTLSRSATHFAEASILLDELAEHDAKYEITGETLSVTTLRQLSMVRAKNLFRYFLHNLGHRMPQAIQLDEMLAQLCEAREDAEVCIISGDLEVRRYQGRVYVLHTLGKFDRDFVMPWNGEEKLEWPALKTLLCFKYMQGLDAQGLGVSMAKLRSFPVTLRLRQGGETMRLGQNASNRTLKNLMQEQRIPPWQRDRMPLLFCGDDLVSVSGVGVAAAYRAEADEAAVQLEW